MKPLISKCSMIPEWHQLVPISGHVEESETARKLQLYATSIKTSVSTRLLLDVILVCHIQILPKLAVNAMTKISYIFLYYSCSYQWWIPANCPECGMQTKRVNMVMYMPYQDLVSFLGGVSKYKGLWVQNQPPVIRMTPYSVQKLV